MVSFFAIANFFKEDRQLIERGENSVRSNHIINFDFDGTNKIIIAKVAASMKDKMYDCKV